MRRSRPPKGYVFAEDPAEQFDDSRDYGLSEHTSRRQKRDSNGKFIRRPAKSKETSSATSVEPIGVAVKHGMPAIESASLATDSSPDEQPASAVSTTRPKRLRQSTRRAESPATFTAPQTNGEIGRAHV